MHLHTRNVNTAFRTLVEAFKNERGTVNLDAVANVPFRRTPSRNGSVIVIDEPVTITYSHPKERVLFNAARDANPFALLYEALWMLAGRNDVDSLAYYTKQFREYSDDGKTLNGAYGYRWRNYETKGIKPHWDVYAANPKVRAPVRTVHLADQLQLLIAHLKADPNSRRAVLSMWNVEDDLLKIGGPCKCTGTKKEPPHFPDCPAYGLSKDICCNLNVMFSIRNKEYVGPENQSVDVQYLDMTVTNRSNDLVWGMLGANYVTFSILQEYMAAHLGVEVGKYHHITNNLHVYDDPGNPKVAPWTPEKWLEAEPLDYREPFPPGNPRHAAYSKPWTTFPLIKDPAVFDKEVVEFVEWNKAGLREVEANNLTYKVWQEPFLAQVAGPMCDAYRWWKETKDISTAEGYLKRIMADDWRIACTSWLQRRKK